MNAPETLYAFDLCSAHSLPGGRMLVRNPRNGRHAVLTPDVYGALLGCRQFRTLSEHASRLAAQDPSLQGQEDTILPVLESVRDDGLMLSADIYAVTLQPATEPRFNVDKPVVAILTWERPDALERCLDSMKANCDLSHFARLVVIDDSRTPEVRERNRATTEAFAAGTDTAVLHLGAEEQKGLLEAIIRQVPSLEEQVRFLIDRERWTEHWTSGLARTLALLLSVGQRLVMIDDDILCEVYEPRGEPGVRFADEPREAAFYGDTGDWQEQRAERGKDPVLRHLRILGSVLSDALGALGVKRLEPADFAGADLDVLERLHGDSRVLITECGSLGDAGTANMNWLATLEGASLEGLLADEATVEQALRLRNCWHGRRRTHILPRANMSQLTGVDHRTLLPPYLPILRGEDRLFGDMVEFLHPDSVVVDQPWAIAHLPLPPREWPEAERRFDTAQPFPHFAREWVEQHQGQSHASDPLKRLAHLARLYEDLADRDRAGLRRLYEEERLAARARDFGEITAALARAPSAPAPWTRFLEDAKQRLNTELLDNPPDTVVRGYPEHLEGDALIDWWRTTWLSFGRALRAWPAIRQAARQVRI